MYPTAQTAKTSGYDRVATMFSPKGRLYQVEYASKIVEQGTIGIGLIYDDGVLLAADKHVASPLVLPASIEKLFKVDNHVGALSSGLVGDARRLVSIAREKAQENYMMYEEPIHVETLVKEISQINQIFTQYAGMRPFGVSLIIAGTDEMGKHVFETEPSGALAEYRAVAIGKGKKEAMVILENEYTDKMAYDDAVKLSVKAIKESKPKEEKFDPKRLDFAIVDDNGFKSVPYRDVKTLLAKTVQ